MRVNLSETLMMTSPEIYQKYITASKKGETVIYVKALNTIYVTMETELYFKRSFLEI